jgi:hypothetical protein
MPDLDREKARELRRRFRDEVRDMAEKYVEGQEQDHGNSLKPWLAHDSVEEVMQDFARFLTQRYK